MRYNATLAEEENQKWSNRQPKATLDVCSEKCFNWENDFIRTIENIFNEDITGRLGDELVCAESYNVGPHTTLGTFPYMYRGTHLSRLRILRIRSFFIFSIIFLYIFVV